MHPSHLVRDGIQEKLGRRDTDSASLAVLSDSGQASGPRKVHPSHEDCRSSHFPGRDAAQIRSLNAKLTALALPVLGAEFAFSQ